MQRREQSQSRDNGADAALMAYLQDYKRITLADACAAFVNLDDVSIGIWVYRNGQWINDKEAECKRRTLDIKNKSLCNSIITKLYGLSQAEYEKIKNSFDEEASRKSLAGIYKSTKADQDFVL